jgi:hypothetical protein
MRGKKIHEIIGVSKEVSNKEGENWNSQT